MTSFLGSAVLFASILFASCSPYPSGVQPYPGQPAPSFPEPPAPLPDPANAPSVYAESALIIDATTGRVLFEKNADQRRAVASTQKLLTALVTINAGPLTKPVTVQAVDTQVVPTKVYIAPGETYQRGYLVKALLVRSGNDVAMALARDVAGSKDAFSHRMNQTALSLGMRNSRFQNPHGLTEPNQFSTARDMAILAREVMKHPYLRSCMKEPSMTFTFPDGRTKTLKNTNKVLERLSYATGMKTGTTKASGRCLISSGTLNGRTVIAIALNSNSANIWDDSEKMLRWALE